MAVLGERPELLEKIVITREVAVLYLQALIFVLFFEYLQCSWIQQMESVQTLVYYNLRTSVDV